MHRFFARATRQIAPRVFTALVRRQVEQQINPNERKLSTINDYEYRYPIDKEPTYNSLKLK